MIEPFKGKTGMTFASRPSKVKPFALSCWNKTHARGFVHRTYKLSISKNSASNNKISLFLLKTEEHTS